METYYDYLGLVISPRLSWYMCQKTLAEQASKALFAVKSSINAFGLLLANLLLKIFDAKILPILTWLNHNPRTDCWARQIKE